MKITLTVAAIAMLGFMVLTFNTSLPLWCANPQGAGNWVVEPLCN